MLAVGGPGAQTPDHRDQVMLYYRIISPVEQYLNNAARVASPRSGIVFLVRRKAMHLFVGSRCFGGLHPGPPGWGYALLWNKFALGNIQAMPPVWLRHGAALFFNPAESDAFIRRQPMFFWGSCIPDRRDGGYALLWNKFAGAIF